MDWGFIIIQVVLFALAISVHESAHAWAADRYGDPTARMLGRISLNPMSHLDIFGTILLPGILIIAGQSPFGYAKPVPVNPLNLRNPRKDLSIISAAGPLSNLALAVLFALLFHAVIRLPLDSPDFQKNIILFCYAGVLINVLLAVFNLIPIPPLDGGGILSGFLPDRALSILDKIQPYGFFILIGLFYLGILGPIIGFMQGIVLSLLGLSG